MFPSTCELLTVQPDEMFNFTSTCPVIAAKEDAVNNEVKVNNPIVKMRFFSSCNHQKQN
jgi:hypothetical protein